MTGRRRGDELEAAILLAAWDELMEVGYPRFTLDGVAARAGTSRPVIARRWDGRAELAMAAIRHRSSLSPVAAPVPFDLPDTGSLRGDTLVYLVAIRGRMTEMLGLLSFLLMSYFEGDGKVVEDLAAEPWFATFTEIREQVMAMPATIGGLLDRAVARGEITADAATPAIAKLPAALLRHDMIMTMARVPDSRLAEIVDELFLPLLRARSRG